MINEEDNELNYNNIRIFETKNKTIIGYLSNKVLMDIYEIYFPYEINLDEQLNLRSLSLLSNDTSIKLNKSEVTILPYDPIMELKELYYSTFEFDTLVSRKSVKQYLSGFTNTIQSTVSNIRTFNSLEDKDQIKSAYYLNILNNYNPEYKVIH